MPCLKRPSTDVTTTEVFQNNVLKSGKTWQREKRPKRRKRKIDNGGNGKKGLAVI